MLPSEAYQHQLGVKRLCHSTVGHVMGSSYYKSNQFQNHQLFRQACHQNETLHSKEYNIHKIHSFDFSKNGDFFVAGIHPGKVALWHTAQFLGNERKPKPTSIMDFHHQSQNILNITTSPDDLRIFSNDGLDEIAIHDAKT